MAVKIDIKQRERPSQPEPEPGREREPVTPKAGEPAAPDPGKLVLEAMRALDQALLLSDRSKVDDLVAGDAKLIGPDGARLDRAKWVAAHESNQRQQVAVETRDEAVQMYDDVAVVTGVKHSKCRFGHEVVEGRFRVVQVWAKSGDNGWQLETMQYTVVQP